MVLQIVSEYDVKKPTEDSVVRGSITVNFSKNSHKTLNNNLQIITIIIHTSQCFRNSNEICCICVFDKANGNFKTRRCNESLKRNVRKPIGVQIFLNENIIRTIFYYYFNTS